MACSLTLIKKFTYRGNPTEEYSNRYYLSGADPSTSADWLALFNALATAEKPLYASNVVIVRGYGYDSDDSKANNVWSRDLTAVGNTTIPGTTNFSAATTLPGDSALWIRWKTNRISSPGGKPIYLRKYYHPAYCTANTPDVVNAGWVTEAQALGAKLRDGSFIDGRTLRAPGRSSETFLGHSVSQYTTVRTLKRRGKRPNS